MKDICQDLVDCASRCRQVLPTELGEVMYIVCVLVSCNAQIPVQTHGKIDSQGCISVVCLF
jgi:hypothetical protein